jgi:hypothetical protein
MKVYGAVERWPKSNGFLQRCGTLFKAITLVFVHHPNLLKLLRFQNRFYQRLEVEKTNAYPVGPHNYG